MSFLAAAWAVLPRVFMTWGTIWMAIALVRRMRDSPGFEQLLDGNDTAVIQAQANTLRRFREVGLFKAALFFQAMSLMFLWVGLAVDHGVLQTFTTWVSMTLAAGGTPLLLTNNAKTWADEAILHQQARQIVLETLGKSGRVSMAGLIQAVEDNEATYLAIQSLEKDELVVRGDVGLWYRLTDTGKALHGLSLVSATGRLGYSFDANQ
jgi:hypothetical protein